MSFHRGRQALIRLGIPIVAISLSLMAAGTVLAGSGTPDTVHVTQVGPLTVSAAGTWSWPEMATASKLSYTGFAIDWGDVTSGNAVGSFHVGDGTAATNVVLQPTSPAQGSSGSFGPVTHTYAKAGSYQVCAILYDLGEVTPFATSGYHSLLAGGPGHNTDNSVDSKQQVSGLCTSLDVTDPTPSPFQSFQGETATPFQSFQGETSNPTSTPPPTTTDNGSSGPTQSLPLLALAILFGSMLTSGFVLRMQRVRR